MAEPGTEAFEKLVGLLNYPMFVVTTQVDGVAAGCLVGFASQASIHPPRFLVGLSTKNHTFRVAANATHLAVHLFDREHLDVVELFGGIPILDDAAAWFVRKILDRFSLGDHVGHLLEPVDGDPPHELERWVSFGDVRDLRPGHEA
jgi:flavin reductase (DIM6/NTAB) family NADH-FMN oxidoreductase RutF